MMAIAPKQAEAEATSSLSTGSDAGSYFNSTTSTVQTADIGMHEVCVLAVQAVQAVQVVQMLAVQAEQVAQAAQVVQMLAVQAEQVAQAEQVEQAAQAEQAEIMPRRSWMMRNDIWAASFDAMIARDAGVADHRSKCGKKCHCGLGRGIHCSTMENCDFRTAQEQEQEQELGDEE